MATNQQGFHQDQGARTIQSSASISSTSFLHFILEPELRQQPISSGWDSTESGKSSAAL